MNVFIHVFHFLLSILSIFQVKSFDQLDLNLKALPPSLFAMINHEPLKKETVLKMSKTKACFRSMYAAPSRDGALETERALRKSTLVTDSQRTSLLEELPAKTKHKGRLCHML